MQLCSYCLKGEADDVFVSVETFGAANDVAIAVCDQRECLGYASDDGARGEYGGPIAATADRLAEARDEITERADALDALTNFGAVNPVVGDIKTAVFHLRSAADRLNRACVTMARAEERAVAGRS